MKHAFFIKSLLAMSLSFGVATFANTTNDGILAKVNDEIILKSEFLDAGVAIAREYRDRGIALSGQELQNLTLDSLINKKLQLGLIRRAGFVPNENIINQELLAIAQRQGFNNLSDFQRSLDNKKAGSYEKLRQSVIEEASIVALWQAQVRPRINISEQEVNAFLNSPEGQNVPHESVLVPQWQTSHILVAVNDTQSESLAEQKINALYSELQKGADFASLAATYSDDTGSATQNGQLGWVGTGQMVQEFERVMKNTEAGDFSVPFRTQFGYHILKVNNTRQLDMSGEARKEKAREILFSRQAPQAEEDWMEELRAGAYIEVID
ncbi:MAG: peptidylprolyl isomerase [Moraxella sp.]|uniref:peptidylprolyl isomerase n=1 Tax=Moraxella sp. TaxID=479 RepID=UPI0026DC5211|nr:peptidylprolyl isomerase [Moraxella sp.]MDO4451160.1 peptidylprolyl isomerase [Moraxella sp.]